MKEILYSKNFIWWAYDRDDVELELDFSTLRVMRKFDVVVNLKRSPEENKSFKIQEEEDFYDFIDSIRYNATHTYKLHLYHCLEFWKNDFPSEMYAVNDDMSLLLHFSFILMIADRSFISMNRMQLENYEEALLMIDDKMERAIQISKRRSRNFKTT